MTLDEIERKAASILTEQWHGQDTIELAEMLLLVMPVARAAEAAADFANRFGEPPGDWACRECRPNSDMLILGFKCAHHGLLASIDTMRRGLGEG